MVSWEVRSRKPTLGYIALVDKLQSGRSYAEIGIGLCFWEGLGRGAQVSLDRSISIERCRTLYCLEASPLSWAMRFAVRTGRACVDVAHMSIQYGTLPTTQPEYPEEDYAGLDNARQIGAMRNPARTQSTASKAILHLMLA